MAPREHPRYVNMEWGEYEFSEFPMMIYPGASDPKKPYDAKGKPLKGVVVQNQEELERVMAKEANLRPTSSPGVLRAETVGDEKEELLLRAGQLGVQVDKKWGVARIQAAIDEHQATPVV